MLNSRFGNRANRANCARKRLGSRENFFFTFLNGETKAETRKTFFSLFSPSLSFLVLCCPFLILFLSLVFLSWFPDFIPRFCSPISFPDFVPRLISLFWFPFLISRLDSLSWFPVLVSRLSSPSWRPAIFAGRLQRGSKLRSTHDRVASEGNARVMRLKAW